MKSDSSLKPIEKRIQTLQRAIAQLGPLRPGCLSRQYRDPTQQKGPYYQLSYTYQMKSKTEYIPPALVPQIRRELAEYQRYKALNQEWIALSIERSRLQIKGTQRASKKRASST